MSVIRHVIYMKICRQCKLEKDLSEFHRKGDRHQWICKECRKTYSKNHYETNKSAYVKRSATQAHRIRKELDEYKEAQGCTDCNQKYPAYVLHFDHLDRTTKTGNISHMVARVSKLRLQDEIAKCEVVCANCHAEREHQRQCSMAQR